MSAESDYKCDKCGYEWCAIPLSDCPKCRTHSTAPSGSADGLTHLEQSIILTALLNFGKVCAPPWKADTRRLHERLITRWANSPNDQISGAQTADKP